MEQMREKLAILGKEKRETKRKLTATQTKLEKALNRKVNLEDEKGDFTHKQPSATSSTGSAENK